MTDAERLKEIRDRLAAVFGDWMWVEAIDTIYAFPQKIEGDVRDVSPMTVLSFDERIGYDTETAEFVANAPQDMRYLLAQLDAANQTIARFEADDERLQAMHTESEARLRQLLAEKDAEIERLNDVIRTLGLALNSAVKPRNPEHLTIKLSDHSEPEGSR